MTFRSDTLTACIPVPLPGQGASFLRADALGLAKAVGWLEFAAPRPIPLPRPPPLAQASESWGALSALARRVGWASACCACLLGGCALPDKAAAAAAAEAGAAAEAAGGKDTGKMKKGKGKGKSADAAAPEGRLLGDRSGERTATEASLRDKFLPADRHTHGSVLVAAVIKSDPSSALFLGVGQMLGTSSRSRATWESTWTRPNLLT